MNSELSLTSSNILTFVVRQAQLQQAGDSHLNDVRNANHNPDNHKAGPNITEYVSIAKATVSVCKIRGPPGGTAVTNNNMAPR